MKLEFIFKSLNHLFFVSVFNASLFLGAMPLQASADEGHIGEIRQSILNESQFQKLYGRTWELMKGQSLDKEGHSELIDLGWTSVPDARGVFLRCSNEGRNQDTGNPDGNLKVGTYQKDQFKLHNHGGGNHDHGYRAGSNDGNVNFGNNTNAGHNFAPGQKTTLSGEIIAKEGGSETRPRCIVVNTFIKVGRSQDNKNQLKLIHNRLNQLQTLTSGSK